MINRKAKKGQKMLDNELIDDHDLMETQDQGAYRPSSLGKKAL